MWPEAETSTLPQYAQGKQINGIFPLSVPYLVPMFVAWGGKRYKVLNSPNGNGGKAVLFRERSWRGVGDEVGEADFLGNAFLTVDEMIDELVGFPPGTVTYVYMTSDGGLTLENAFLELAEKAPPQLEIVSADTLTRLALTAEENAPWISLRGILCNLSLGFVC